MTSSSGRKRNRSSKIEEDKLPPLRVAHFNVRTLRDKGNANKHEVSEKKIQDLKSIMERHSIDIMGLSETHLFPSESKTFWERSFRGYHFYLSNRCPGAKKQSGPQEGVGFLIRGNIKPQILPILESPDPSRIISMILTRQDNTKIQVIEAYSPTADNESEGKIKFYKDLGKAVLSGKDDGATEVILLGDFNAKIGRPDGWQSIIGRYPEIEDPRRPNAIFRCPNENGIRLLYYCRDNNLRIVNYDFERSNTDKWTWRSPGGRYTNCIDFIIKTNKSSKLTVTKFSIEQVANMSDHRLIWAEFKVIEEDEEEEEEKSESDGGSKLTPEKKRMKMTVKVTASQPCSSEQDAHQNSCTAAAECQEIEEIDDDDSDMPTIHLGQESSDDSDRATIDSEEWSWDDYDIPTIHLDEGVSNATIIAGTGLVVGAAVLAVGAVATALTGGAAAPAIAATAGKGAVLGGAKVAAAAAGAKVVAGAGGGAGAAAAAAAAAGTTESIASQLAVAATRGFMLLRPF